MSIDWFTFAAQVINFLVLVGLLRWLLYAPIVGAMREREQRIASRLAAADQQRQQAADMLEEYEEKMRQIEQQREHLLSQARHAAHEEHRRMLQEQRHEVDRKRTQWEETYSREREDFFRDLRLRAGHIGVEIASRTLSELADAELEGQMLEAFAARLRRLDEEQHQEIVQRLRDADAQASIRSAFDVSDERRERLQRLISEIFESEADIVFEKSEEMICGLELDIGGYSFGWNVKEFLRDLDLEFRERLKVDGGVLPASSNLPKNT